jgi:short subunit fatty acids transporter
MINLDLFGSEEMISKMSIKDFRERIEQIEKLLIESNSDEVYVGNSEQLPLTHSFSDGIYVREIFIKKGMFAIGKIHKFNHTFFLMKGKLLLCSEEGIKQIEAPYYGNSSAGTKRVVIALEDTIFVNVHPNPNNIKEIEKLEENFVLSSYEEYDNYKLLNN